MIRVIRFASGMVHIELMPDDLPQFKELVHRATNLWPDASPEIKTFADDITHDGVQMQDYTRPTVTNQPKFCSTLLTACRSGCKGNSCKVKKETT
jgi:hypothetical protein